MSIQIPLRVRLRVSESPESVRLGIGTQIVAGGAPPYSGAYEVTPRLNNPVILPTDGKVMMNNVTVHEIPVTRTTNPYEGLTVIIG